MVDTVHLSGDRSTAGIWVDLSLPRLVEAIEANMVAFRALLGSLPSAELHDEPDVLWFTNHASDLSLNAVLQAEFRPREADARIEEILGAFRARSAPLIWWTGPLSSPTDLGERLVAHGLVHHGDVTGMAADLTQVTLPEAPAGLEAKVVCDAETLQAYDTVLDTSGLPTPAREAVAGLYVDRGFGQHAWRRYVGLLDGEPVAASDLYVGSGVAGVYDVTTVERARRRGVGTAMTATALREARQLGYRVAILHATEMALEMYRQLGFEAQCVLSQYVVFWSFPW